MRVIDAGKKLFLNTLSAAAIALSGCSSGTVENNYICDQKGCLPVTSAQPSSSSGLSLEKKITNSKGSITVFNQQINITNDYQQPLPNITVYGLQHGQQTLYLAVDPSGNHYPTALSKNNGTLESHLEISPPAAKPGSQNNTDGIVNLILKTIDYSQKIIATFANADGGDFIREMDDVNIYCMTLEQMKISYIFVPAGIIFLTTPEGIAGKTVKIANTAALNQIFDAYVHAMYGEENGYLVAVPQTAINLCGQEYENAVCPITTDILSKNVWSKQDIPIWEIRGGCTPSKKSSKESIYYPNSGLQWQKNASSYPMNLPEAEKFCTYQDGDWRLPSRNELDSIMNGSTGCLLPETLNGPCDWYWANDQSCSSLLKPLIQVNFSNGESRCVSEGATAYVFCVKEL